MAEGPGFDLSKMTTAAKIILAGGILYLINLFLPWNKTCIGGGSIEGLGEIPSACVTAAGTTGIGVLNLILVLVIIAMEIVVIMGLEGNMPMQAEQRQMIASGMVGLLLILTLLRVLIGTSSAGVTLDRAWPGWLGLILAGVMSYGAFMRFQEAQAAGGGAPPPGDAL